MDKINCKLNKRYNELLQKKNIVYGGFKQKVNIWPEGMKTVTLKGFGEKDSEVSLISGSDLNHHVHRLTCCGISELYFEPLMKKANIENHTHFDELVAKYMYHGLGNRDRRIVITGIPTKVKTNSSQYRLSFYQKLREVLDSIGFIELQKQPYKNKSSGNSITVIVGQLPMLRKVPHYAL